MENAEIPKALIELLTIVKSYYSGFDENDLIKLIDQNLAMKENRYNELWMKNMDQNSNSNKIYTSTSRVIKSPKSFATEENHNNSGIQNINSSEMDNSNN